MPTAKGLGNFLAARTLAVNTTWRNHWLALTWILVLFCFTGTTAAQVAQFDPAVGIPQFSTQIAGQYDSVNPATGNVLISIPIREKTGKIPVALKLLANFHLYDSTPGVPPRWVMPLDNMVFTLAVSAGDFGAIVSFVNQSTPFACKPGMFFEQWSNFAVLDETGASHPTQPTIIYSDPSCGQTQATVQTTDGSGFTVELTVTGIPNSPVLHYSLIDRSGNVHQSQNGPPINNVTDPDGVQVTTSTTAGSGGAVIGTLIDSLGQTVLTTNSNPSSPGSPVTYQYTDANGKQQTVTVNSSQYTLQTNFGCSDVTDDGPASVFLPSSIVLADGETFGLSYEPTPGNSANVTGRIGKLTLPLGGSITYGYAGGNNGIYCGNSGFIHTVPTLTRTVSDGSGNAGTYTYVNNNTTGAVSPLTVTETDPQGNVTAFADTATLSNKQQGRCGWVTFLST